MYHIDTHIALKILKIEEEKKKKAEKEANRARQSANSAPQQNPTNGIPKNRK